MGIINEIINDFQKEKLNAQYLKDYDYDFTDGKWNWPMLNAEIDLFQGVTSWAHDLVIGVVWLINPFHWDDAIEGVGYSVTHISEVVPAIMDEVKTTYEEQGLVYCVGYVIPEVLAYFYGVGEAKAVSKLEKVDDITKLGKYTYDAPGKSIITSVKKQEILNITDEINSQIKEVSLTQYPKKPIDLELVGLLENSFTEEQLELLADMSTYYYDADSMVLGKYNYEGSSYILDAIKSESTYFSTGDEIWNAIEQAGMPKSEVWRLNQIVLDRTIAEGKSIKFSHNPEFYVTDDSYFGMEVDYLKGKGYKFVEIEGEWYATI